MEKLEKMQMERDKAMIEFLSQQFYTTFQMIAATVNVKLPDPSGVDANDRGEIPWT